MVMEYIEGITLKEYLRLHNEKIGWQETLKMMEPVIQSFEYIHDAGIIHRDISPDNIMVSPDETITIIDFGSARGFEDDSKSKTIVLKHGYAPPEQYYKNGQQGTWTDVYSLCATIYRMITGTKLPESLAIKSKDASIIPLRKFDKNIPSDIEAAVIRGLSVDIAERISNMKDLKEYLYKGRKVRTSKAQKRFFVKLFGGIILITAAVGILVPLIWNVSSQSRESDLVDVTDVSDDVENSGSDTTLENFQDEDQENQEEMIDTDYTDIGDLTYINSGNSITITGADYTVTDVIIPPEIENLPVKAITGMGSNVTSIVIPEGVEIIGENAFRNCVYLESVSIPSTVSVIQDGAFSNCRSLNNILIDEDNLYFYNQGGQVYEKE